MKSLKSLSNISRFAVVGFAALTLLVLNVPVEASNLVTNGSFETTTLTHSGFLNNSDVPGWRTTSGYTFLVFPGTGTTNLGNGIKFWPGTAPDTMPATSPDGGNFLTADGAYLTGTLSQTITGLTAGQDYTLSFYQAGAQQEGFSGDTTDRWQVNLGGETELSTLLTNPSHGFSPWTRETLNFRATAASEVLGFLAVGTPQGVPPFSLLDGVSLVAAPEPAYLGMAGLSLLSLCVIRRRSRKRR